MSEVVEPTDGGDEIPIEIDRATFDYIEEIVPEIAEELFPGQVERDDLIQTVLSGLVNNPPVWKPALGATRETFIYRCVHCDLLNLRERMKKENYLFPQAPKPKIEQDESGNSRVQSPLDSGEAPRDYIAAKPTEDEILAHIEGEENRRLCRAYIKYDGNATKTAKEIGVSDKTVRRKLERLAPKLLAAGYEPPPKLKRKHNLYVRPGRRGKRRGRGH